MRHQPKPGLFTAVNHTRAFSRQDMKKTPHIFASQTWFIVVVGLFCAAGMPMLTLPAIAQDEEVCPEPPSALHLQYAFNWPVVEQQKLAQKFAIRCGGSADLDTLLKRTAQSLSDAGITLIRSQLIVKDEFGQTRILMQTEQDDNRLRTAILPIRRLVKDDRYFALAEINGTATEGEELTLRYVVDDTRLQEINGTIGISWTRDGVLIPKQNKTRYRLGEQDIGRKISAKIIFTDERGVVYASRTAPLLQRITMRRTAPELRGLTITGQAVIGKILQAEYQFYDRNPEDREKDSQFQWLRNGFEIPNATDRNYLIVPQDLGATLSVRVIPNASDGQRGKVYSTSLDKAVEDELVTLRPQILSEVNADENKEGVFNPVLSSPDPIGAEPKEEIVLTAAALPSPSVIRLAAGLSIANGSPRRFSGIAFTENTILQPEVLDEIEGRVIGQDITLENIKAALEAVNKAYEEAGYELSRALLPEQVITDGQLKIQLVQTRIGKITFENANRLKEAFLREHLRLDEGDYISLATLERNIRLYNAGNKSKLKTELAPGENFGETDVFVQVEEPRAIELPSISVDNYANQMTDWRNNSFSFVLNNFLGREDETTITVSDAKGSATQAMAFAMPLTAHGTNISANISRSQTTTVGGNESIIGYRGRSYSGSLGISHPLTFQDDYSVYMSASLGESYNQLTQAITGDMLSKSRGRKFALSLPMNYTTGRSSYSFSPTWSVINTETEIPPQEVWVQKFDGDLSSSHLMAPWLTANFRGKFLYTRSKKMLNMPGEILSVGGPSSVRAYQPSESSGYMGYFVSGELRTDLANWDSVKMPEQMPNLQPYIFIDHMMARAQFQKDTREDYWSGYGFGINIPNLFNALSIDAYIAESLDGDVHKLEQEAYNEQRIQFSVNANFDFLQN